MFVTDSIARSAKRRYISYSEGDFEVFRPQGDTLHQYRGKIWHGGVDRPLLRAKLRDFHKICKSLYPLSGCVSCQNLDRCAQGVTELWGFK